MVHADFRHIEVRITPWLSLRGVAVDGGQVQLTGSISEIREALDAWRARHRGASEGSGGSGRSSLPIEAHDIDVMWRASNAASPGSDAKVTTENDSDANAKRDADDSDSDTDAAPGAITGIHFERDGERARARFASARFESASGSLTLSDASAEFATGPEGMQLESARVAQLLGRVSLAVTPDAPDVNTTGAREPAAAASDLDDDEELLDDKEEKELAEPKGRKGAAEAKGAADGKEAADAADAAEAKAKGKTLADRLAPLAAQSWPKRREQLDGLRRLLRARLAERARVDVTKVQLEVTHGASVLNFGPAPLSFQREGSVASLAFLPPAEKGDEQLTLNGRLPLDEGSVELNLQGGPISLQTLGVREGDFGLLGVKNSALSMQTHVELTPAGALGVVASGRLTQLSIAEPALAPEPLRDMNLNWSGQVRLDLGQRKFAIEDGSLGLEDVRVTLSGSIEAVDNDVRVALSIEVPKTPCQDMLAAAPPTLLPMLQGLRLGGSFALHSRVALDTSDPSKTEAEWELDNKCKVLATPAEIDPDNFRAPFQHFVMEADGRATEFTTGPTTELWVPLNEITPYMETGLIVCEDSRFFKHDGFDNKAIRDSILSNLKKGHFVRGASTLSMQLAKNLYLNREKTLSRKFQEAAFTLLLEERLSKEDILELYLNVVEFGPGVYGIRNAAMHYFNSHPGELSLAQAMFLASILPNPKVNHFMPDGTLKPRWAKHLQYIMRVANKIHRISDEELEAGQNEQLVFGKAHQDTSSDFLFGAPLYDVNSGG
ncbi:MAG TPA: biosynthetic peptidoglycan transglycosylase [Polyangiaceae bacterium]|nr:biosynthetic peptidoglycan transglycosylase [Polyangiaceae bacterium]